MQLLELIIFAGLAAIVLYQLYSVLGRRVGRPPKKQQAPEGVGPTAPRVNPPPESPDEGVSLSGLAAVRARDPSFDISRFLAGAKSAYEMIVKGFASGDRPMLRKLLSPPVMASFDTAIAQRESEGRTESVEFLHPPRADLERAETGPGEIARLTVRFLAEFRSRSKGPEGEAVEDRRTAELWTFERNLKSRDPNWTLIHVAAAEA